MKSSQLIWFGATGHPRPDVKVALTRAPHDYTGFEVRATLPEGKYILKLEVELTDGSWHNLITREVDVAAGWLPRWLFGAEPTELLAFQMPAHMTHSPHEVRFEDFPIFDRSPFRPKLSIVTPSYQHARYLQETIRSVLAEASVDCGYVVQDGGSSDGSDHIIRQYESQLHSWISEADKGQADARAKGFAKTSGNPDDLMAWINSDDFYVPGTLTYVTEYFSRHPEVDVIYGHRILVNENSQEIGRWFLPKHDDAVLRLNDFVPQETMFWRRRIWDKAGGIDPSFKFAMDWDLLLRFQAAGAKIVRVPYFLACFRVHAAQKTSAQMHSVGQKEIDQLRERTQGRAIPPQELEQNPRLLRYLRRSAFIEFLWKLGLRVP